MKNENDIDENFVEETSSINFKKYIINLLRKWPYIIVFFAIAVMLGFGYNRYLTPVYLVKTRITTKKFSDKQGSPVPGLIDASFFLNGLIEVYEEIPILKSRKRIAAAIDKVDFHVSYFSKGLVKTNETDRGHGFVVTIDTILHEGYPHSIPIYVNQISAEEYELNIDDSKWEHLSKRTNKFGRKITLGAVVLKIDNTNGKSEEHDKYYFVLNRKEDLVNEYSRRLDITWALRGSAMLDVKLEGEVPVRDLKFLNAYYAAVEEIALQEKNETLDNTMQFIDGQMAIVNDSLNYYQALVDNLKLENRKMPLGSESVFSKLNELDNKKAEILLNERYLDYYTRYYNNKKNNDEVFAPSLEGLNVPLMEEWVRQYIGKRLTEKELRTPENALNPLVNREDSLKRKLDKGIFEAMASARDRNRQLMSDIDRQINEIYSGIGGMQQDVLELNKNQRLLQINSSLFDLFIRRRAEAAISKASATSDYKVIDAPSYSRTPVRPDEDLNLAIAAALGLFLPVSFFLFRDITNPRIMDRDDLDRHLHMQLVGNVAHSKYDTNKVVKDYPRSVVAESFRAVRTNLKFITKTEKRTAHIFSVTSSIGGEGKTFCTINLAFMLSFTGKRTLMIGADLRKPQLGKYIDSTSKVGLSNYLAGMVAEEEIIRQGEEGDPDFIDAGIIPPNPSELLGSERMHELIEYLQNKYDYIIFDTAPIGLVSDARELFKYCDYNILIVRQGVTPKRALRMIDELHSEGKLKNFAVLLNDIELVKSKNSYYGGYLYGMGYGGYGYGYYEEDKDKGK